MIIETGVKPLQILTMFSIQDARKYMWANNGYPRCDTCTDMYLTQQFTREEEEYFTSKIYKKDAENFDSPLDFHWSTIFSRVSTNRFPKITDGYTCVCDILEDIPKLRKVVSSLVPFELTTETDGKTYIDGENNVAIDFQKGQ